MASAQVPESLSEKDFLSDMPIVLSVSRLPQRLDETPGAVTLLDRDMIRLSGARDVADLLRLVPGFQSSNAFESVAPVASYHGGFAEYSNRIQVLVDGRSVYSPYFIGSVGPGLQTVALEDIERIEVLRGSNSAAYGARAMLGVINIVTRHTVDTLGQQASLASGENGIQDAQARIGWGQDSATFRLSMDRRADSGLSGANGVNQINRVNFRGDLRPTSQDDIQLRAGGFVIDSGKGFVSMIKDGNPPRATNFESSYVQLDWRRNLTEDQDLALKFSHNEEAYKDSFPFQLINLDPIIGPLLFSHGEFYTVEGSGWASADSLVLEHTIRYNPDLSLVWGSELRQERVKSRPLYDTDAAFTTDFTRIFGNAEWRITPKLIANVGAMLEKSNVSDDSLAPRLMLNWHFAKGQTLRAGVSKAFRPPSVFEQDANVRWRVPVPGLGIKDLAGPQGGGNLQPESVVAQEIGYLGDFPALGLSLDVRAFHEQVAEFIRLKTDSSQTKRYRNDETFAMQGVEYQLTWSPWRGAKLMFNQTYIDINSTDRGTALAAPKLASSLTIFQKLPGGLDLSLMHQDNGTVTLQGSGNQNQSAMTRTDLRLGWPLRFGPNRGEIALVVQNLGTPYADFSPEFEFQRRAFVTLRVEN